MNQKPDQRPVKARKQSPEPKLKAASGAIFRSSFLNQIATPTQFD